MKIFHLKTEGNYLKKGIYYLNLIIIFLKKYNIIYILIFFLIKEYIKYLLYKLIISSLLPLI